MPRPPSRRSWDDRWQRYPPSVPLPAEGGLATSKQRGPMAGTWWSQRFTALLESYGLGTRMQRGRRYARAGQVLNLSVTPGLLVSQVQGSRRTPYVVTVAWPEPTAEQWQRIEGAMTAKIGFAARLLGGEVPPELEEVFDAAGVPLFPRAWADLRPNCSCPDWESPCKHIAAVLYLFADQLDEDPWLVLALRGRRRDQLFDDIRGRSAKHGIRSGPGAEPDEVAPWWPFAPRPLPLLGPVDSLAVAAEPERPDAVLDTMAPMEVSIAGEAVDELLRPLYALLVDDSLTEDGTDFDDTL